MLSAMSPRPAVPWYREPLVWMVIAIPGSAVVFGIFMLTVSVMTYDGLVVDDYYKRGLEINRVLDRDRVAAVHGLQADLRVTPGSVVVRLQANAGFPMPASLALGFYHATRGGLDRSFTLHRDASGDYRGEFAPLAAGGWDVQVESGDWRLLGRLVAGQAAPLRLTPSAAGG